MLKIFNKLSSLLKKKKDILYIDSEEDWSLFKNSVENENIVGIDTEFDWRTTYLPILCLIQLSTKDRIFLLDCNNLKSFKNLKKILESDSIMKIFHSIRSDSTVLSNCLDISLENVFDIQQAEKVLTQGEILSYGAIVKKYKSISLDKSETNSNWLRRPLSDKQISYAAEDVNYLIEIFYLQKKVLSNNEFQKALNFSNKESSLGKENLGKLRLIKKKNKLSKREQEIFIWRESIAKDNNVPPNYIFKEKYISSLAKYSDKNKSEYRKSLLKIIGDSKYVEEFIIKFV